LLVHIILTKNIARLKYNTAIKLHNKVFFCCKHFFLCIFWKLWWRNHCNVNQFYRL